VEDRKDGTMISYRGFTKRFGAQPAVESLTLDVARGEVVALLGPNGSGKTTTLKAAAGLILPTAGQVTLGDPPRAAALPEARRVLSYLPQKVSFPDALTGSEVVEFYRELRGAPPERSQKVLRFASLNGAGERPVGTYSGGMVQRLGLAVAMLPEAPVFLLDEPTAALDPGYQLEIAALLRRVNAERGVTMVLATHDLNLAASLCTDLVLLRAGRVLTAGPTREVLTRESIRRLYDVEADVGFNERAGHVTVVAIRRV
jgi:Cu-processing system ATP-binding protein